MAEGEMQAVSIAHSSQLLQVAETHPRFTSRGAIVMSLIESYGLLNHPRLHVVSPIVATVKELTSFHSKDYIQQLQKASTDDESTENEQCGLEYDCPVFPGLFSYVCYVTGASLTMVDCLIFNKSRVAINWYGGWHHGKKDEASGFCYCNDIVLAILRLLSRFKRILYIDLDIHHGDGVQEAFEYSSSVLTLSMHKYCPGFFPGTGSETDIGSGSGQYYTINIPLLDGITDDQYIFIFKSVVNKIHQCYCPDVLVIQCGADCLAGDPLGSFNVTLNGIGECVQEVLQWGLPTLLLGGGGYNFTNTAKCWAYLTGLTIGETLSLDIPDHKYYMSYSPSFLLDIDTINRQSEMTSDYITKLLDSVQQKLEKISTINL